MLLHYHIWDNTITYICFFMCITPRFSRYIVGATVYGEIWHVNVHVNVETRRGTSLRMERVVWYGRYGIVRCGTFCMGCTDGTFCTDG